MENNKINKINKSRKSDKVNDSEKEKAEPLYLKMVIPGV